MTAEELTRRVILSVRAGAPFDEIVGILQPIVRDAEKYNWWMAGCIVRLNDETTYKD